MIADHQPFTYLITAGQATAATFDQDRRAILSTVTAAVMDRVSFVQLREKHLTTRRLYELAVEIAAITRGTGTRLFINDRADVALAAGADGVHLPAESLPPAVVRAAFSDKLLIGVSVHSNDEAVAARDGGADLCVFGPVFDTPGKGPARGLAELRQICSQAGDMPVLALGGINEDNAEAAIRAGAAGIAAIRALNDGPSRRKIVRDLGNIRLHRS